MSDRTEPVLVGQANCLGAGMTYGWDYGNPWDLLREAGFDAGDCLDGVGAQDPEGATLARPLEPGLASNGERKGQ